ncbi:hypothetical protein [Leptolyngbya sp. NK1-12]|nr:hypothetical protein [Leptolyngbya sp. NK1-12]
MILPPIQPDNPVMVYVAEHGMHARLVLPMDQRRLIQYAYGDWKYYALNQQDWENTIAASLIPTQGALGRREFNHLAELQQVSQQERATLLGFAVAGADAIQLLQALNQRFDHQIHTRVQNLRTGLTLVQDEQDYTLFHNSNHELVMWLKALGCRVRGFVLWANFDLWTDYLDWWSNIRSHFLR